MNDKRRLRCAIYTRKSTTQNLDSDFSSLDAQREACEHYIRAHTSEGWDLLPGKYDDGGFTGANTERPGFQALMEDVKKKKVDLVVVYKVDRLSRSLLDFAKVMDQFNKAGVEFVSVTQNFSTANALGKLTLNILMSFAEFEREMISERTRDKIRGARRRGKWTGGRAPYGYQLVDKALRVDPATASVVREVFDLYLDYKSIMATTRELARRGRLKPEHRTNDPVPWDKKDVLRALRNATYAGLIEADGEWVQGQHEAIVSRDTFDRAQHHLDSRTTVGGPQRNPDYLLRGILRCAPCGQLMTSVSARRNEREYRYYRCSFRDRRSSDACPTGQVPAAEIEDVVARRLQRALRQPVLLVEVRERLVERVERQRRELQLQRAELPRAIVRARGLADQARLRLSEATSQTIEQVNREIDQADEAVRVHEHRLAEVNSSLSALDELETEAAWIGRTLERFDELWEMMTPDNRGRLLRAVVRAVDYDAVSGTIRTTLVVDDESAPTSEGTAA